MCVVLERMCCIVVALGVVFCAMCVLRVREGECLVGVSLIVRLDCVVIWM